jgi:hypothetical protein
VSAVRHVRDPLAVWNERVKLRAATVNALAIGLVGFAILRPLTEDVSALGAQSLVWGIAGLAMHSLAHYIIGRLRREASSDDL